MCWVTLERAAKLAAPARRPRPGTRPGAQNADEIRDGHPQPRPEARHPSSALRRRGALDTSTLLADALRFLPRATIASGDSVLAIADELTEDSFVLRYRTGETADGLSGTDGRFLICSFWLVSGLAIIGEQQRAHDLMERLLRVASPLGLTPRNWTRARAGTSGICLRFSRLALIEAAARIVVAEELAAFS